jgi:hypothetical protein
MPTDLPLVPLDGIPPDDRGIPEVEIAPGVFVPERFTTLVLSDVPEVVVNKETGQGFHQRLGAVVEVAVIDKVPRLRSVILGDRLPQELEPLTWAMLLDTAIATVLEQRRLEAAGWYAVGVYPTDDQVNEARQYRRRNRVTDDLLERTARLYLEGGARAVADELHVSRRQADRYVARAREAELL